MELSKTFTFESSHILPRHPGKCSRLHGHSWKLRVYVSGEVNKDTGFVKDFAEISMILKPLIDELDHRHLGQWSAEIFNQSFIKEDHFVHGLPFDFYPSSENLIVWIGNWLLNPISGDKGYALGLNWSKLELDETCTSRCILTREEFERLRNEATARRG